MTGDLYPEKLRRLESETLLPALDAESRALVREIATAHRFTFQELRRVAEAARDLEMWREESLGSWWRRVEAEIGGNGRERKKRSLHPLVSCRLTRVGCPLARHSPRRRPDGPRGTASRPRSRSSRRWPPPTRGGGSGSPGRRRRCLPCGTRGSWD